MQIVLTVRTINGSQQEISNLLIIDYTLLQYKHLIFATEVWHVKRINGTESVPGRLYDFHSPAILNMLFFSANMHPADLPVIMMNVRRFKTDNYIVYTTDFPVNHDYTVSR